MVASETILRDVIFFMKDELNSNITDPLPSRLSGERFVMTSYPERETKYPVITIKDVSIDADMSMALQSITSLVRLTMEVRIWARNVKERDTLTDSVFNTIRNIQLGINDTSAFQGVGLHDIKWNSTNIDEVNGPKSKVIELNMFYIAS